MNETSQEIVKFIKKKAKETGTSIREISKQSGVTEVTANRIFYKEDCMDVNKLEKMLNVFGYEIAVMPIHPKEKSTEGRQND